MLKQGERILFCRADPLVEFTLKRDKARAQGFMTEQDATQRPPPRVAVEMPPQTQPQRDSVCLADAFKLRQKP